MAVLATDDFNRADSASMGANWTISTGGGGFTASGMRITSNACVRDSDADACEFYTGAPGFPNDQYAQAKITVSGTSSGPGYGVSVRASSASSTAFRAIVSKAVSNNIEVARFVAGAFTSLGFRTTTWVDGDVLRMEIIGTTLRVFQNGSQLGADISATGIDSGAPGVAYSSSTLGSIDDWEGGDFNSTPSVAWIGA